MIICAIDPGITGALAFYEPTTSGLGAVYDMPIVDGDVDPHTMTGIIKLRRPDVAVLEHVHPHPKEGVSSVWRFAAAFTTARVVVSLLHIPLLLVTPAKWKRTMNVKGGPEGKEQCRRLAIERFPGRAGDFSRKKDHGRAEAALLALYASQLQTLRNHHHEL
jgi:hypothetical protein